MAEHLSEIMFSIEESVWLNKGETIATVLHMSLQPEIMIREKGEEVHITGHLQLSGAYIPENDRSQNERDELRHLVPIDITIPRERIAELEDVYVEVQSFDYDVPEKSCIQLTADIRIGGMVQRADEKEKDERKEPNRVLHPDAQTTFSYEAKKEPAEVLNDQEEKEQEEEEKTPKALLLQHREKRTDQKEEELENKEVAAIEESEKVEDKTAQAEVEDEQIEEDIEEEREEITEEEIIEEKSAEMDVDVHAQKDPVEEEKEEEQRKSHALYLTKMMAEEEDRFTKVRMCIVQANESLHTIAERYDVSPSQIIRMNDLHEEMVEAGQILYIPVQKEYD